MMVSDFKPGKRGLNSQLRPVLRGGDGSHTLPNHVTGNGRSTQYSQWVIKPTRRTARNFLFHTNNSRPLLNIYIVFVTGEDDIARSDSRRYTDTYTDTPTDSDIDTNSDILTWTRTQIWTRSWTTVVDSVQENKSIEIIRKIFFL